MTTSDQNRSGQIDVQEFLGYRGKHKILEWSNLLRQRVVTHYNHKQGSNVGDHVGDHVGDQLDSADRIPSIHNNDLGSPISPRRLWGQVKNRMIAAAPVRSPKPRPATAVSSVVLIPSPEIGQSTTPPQSPTQNAEGSPVALLKGGSGGSGGFWSSIKSRFTTGGGGGAGTCSNVASTISGGERVPSPILASYSITPHQYRNQEQRQDQNNDDSFVDASEQSVTYVTDLN